LFIALAAAALPLNAQTPLTLQQTIDQVLARYPTLDAAQAAVDAARGRTLRADSARLPQVSGVGSYTYITPRPDIAFNGSSFYTTAQNTYQIGVSGTQLLTDFGRTDALVAAAKAGELSARDALDAARSQLGYQVIQSFYGVLLLRQSVAVSDDEIRALQEALRIANRKFSGGTATKFDVLTTQVRLATAQNNRTDLQASLEKQETLLRQYLGLGPQAPVLIQGEFPTPAALPDLSAQISVGLENRPEMKVAQDQERAAGYQLTAADRENRPEFDARALGGMQDGQLPNLYSNRSFFEGGVSLSIPLFTGRRITGDRTEARAGSRSAQDRVAELDRMIATEVSDAFSDLRSASARLQTADVLVQQADEALALAQTRYSNGVITNFELLDAQSDDRNAALARVDAHYRWALARQALAQATGAGASATP
jgi:outer membrane protein